MNANTSTNPNPNILIINKDRRKKIKSDYGVPYECVELVRRFYNQYYSLTFPSIKDAYEMFKKIESLIYTTNNQVILLQTIISSNIQNMQVSDILFWKRNEKNWNYGHVAIVIYVDKKNFVLAQQNEKNSMEIYNTEKFIQKINNKNSQFIGLKRLPNWIQKPEIIYVKIL
jgi:hypothetical protein